MATKKNYLYFGSEKVNPVSSTDFDFDESDIWNYSAEVGSASAEPKKAFFSARIPKKTAKKHIDDDKRRGVSSTSLPVNVPDWSKILGREYKNRTVEIDDKDGGEGDDHERIPPHEYLARTRNASGSVQEGIGRTLKGRDMRRVRNAIWKQTGFED